MERTLILVKPDAVQRGLIGEVLGRLERRGLRLVALRLMQADEALARRHYAEHEGKPFFAGLVDYITSSPLVAAVFEGPDAVAAARQTMGSTNPVEAAPGTIRGDFALEVGRNLVHGSDGPESAAREIALFFGDDAAALVGARHGPLDLRVAAVSGGLLAPNRRRAIDRAVERSHHADARALGARDEVGIGEVEAVHLVQLDGAIEQRAVHHADGAEREYGPQRLGDLEAGGLVEGLQHVGDLGKDQIRQQQLVRLARDSESPEPGLLGRLAGEMADQDVRIDESRHRRAAALVRRASRSTSSQGVPRFAAGTLTEPASWMRSGLRAMIARSPSTLKRTSSPSLMASASRTARGIVSWPFELTRADTSIRDSLLPSP